MQQTVGLRCLKHRYMCEDERAMSRTSYHCTTSIREARPVIPLRVMATTHDLPNSLSSRTASQNLSSTDRCRRSNTRRVGTTNATPVLLDERRPTEATPEPIQNNYSNQGCHIRLFHSARPAATGRGTPQGLCCVSTLPFFGTFLVLTCFAEDWLCWTPSPVRSFGYLWCG